MRERANPIRRTALPVLALAIALAGCSQPRVQGDARAADAPDRIPALIRQADPQHAPGNQGLKELVRALDDDDPAVRLFAVQALRERTGRAFGYRYYDSAERRRPAVRAWRAWLDGQDGATDPQTPNTAGTPAPGTDPAATPGTTAGSPDAPNP